MIYLIFGTDIQKSREKLKTLTAQLIKDKKNLSIFSIDEENFSEENFNELIKTDNLFQKKKIVVIRRVFHNPAIREYLIGNLERCLSLVNIFIFWEEFVAPDYLSGIAQFANKIWEYQLSERPEGEFDEDKKLFNLTDAFSLRKRHDAWCLYQEAILRGISVESVFWKILWQIKVLLMVKRGDKLNWHPYFYKKIQKSATLFTLGELSQYSSELISLYHDNRYHLADLGVGLEKFILKI